MSIPTLIRKNGMNMAFPTNSTLLIRGEFLGMSRLRANPDMNAPIIDSIPASSATNGSLNGSHSAIRVPFFTS